jgi:hypothetical protein
MRTIQHTKETKLHAQREKIINELQYEYQTTTEIYHVILSLNKKLQAIKEEILQSQTKIQELKEKIAKLIEYQEQKGKEKEVRETNKKENNQYLMYTISNNICVEEDTIKHIGLLNNYGSAICKTILPNNQPSVFVLSVDSSPLYGGTCGIISNTTPKRPYHNDKTFYGWHYQPVVIKAGDLIYEDGWPGLRDGDEVIFKYEPLNHTLQALHRQLNRVFTIYDIPDIPFHRSLMLYKPGSCMRIRRATENDLRTLKWE